VILGINLEIIAGLMLWTICVSAVGVLPVMVRRSWLLQAPPIDVLVPVTWVGLAIGGAVLLALGFGLAG
jgi:hypothetical protein